MAGDRKHHPIVKKRVMYWPFCQRCGLIFLKNRASEKAARLPCPDAE